MRFHVSIPGILGAALKLLHHGAKTPIRAPINSTYQFALGTFHPWRACYVPPPKYYVVGLAHDYAAFVGPFLAPARGMRGHSELPAMSI